MNQQTINFDSLTSRVGVLVDRKGGRCVLDKDAEGADLKLPQLGDGIYDLFRDEVAAPPFGLHCDCLL